MVLDTLRRATQPSGYPVDNPTQSFWLENPPCPELMNLKMDVPYNRADTVIIGSGMTAAAVAFSIMREHARNNQEAPTVVVLEARGLSSGATGRHDGSINSAPHELFHQLILADHEPEQAADIVRFVCIFLCSHILLMFLGSSFRYSSLLSLPASIRLIKCLSLTLVEGLRGTLGHQAAV